MRTLFVLAPLTPEIVVATMLKLAAVRENDTVYDLGCGDGRIVITAAKDFKARRGLGLGFNPERLKGCEQRMKDEKLTDAQRKKLEFKRGDVLKLTPEAFKGGHVVTLYLYPPVNLRLMPVLKNGLKPASRVVSHDFKMGTWKEDKKEVVRYTKGGRERSAEVFLWVITKDDKA